MRGSAIILLGLMASLLIVVGLALAMPSMDDFDLDNPGWNGLSKFKSMVEPNSGLEGLNPVDSVLFLIGPSKPFSEADVSAFKMFLMEGGLSGFNGRLWLWKRSVGGFKFKRSIYKR